MVNNASVEITKPFLDVSNDEWNRVIGVNLFGAYLVSQVTARQMVKHGVTVAKLMEVTAEALDLGLLKHATSARTRNEGFIDAPNQRLGIHITLPVVSPEDLAEVPLRSDATGG